MANSDPQIESLLRQMTLEEKVGQLTILQDEIRNTPAGVNPEFKRRKIEALKEDIRTGRVGALFNGQGEGRPSSWKFSPK